MSAFLITATVYAPVLLAASVAVGRGIPVSVSSVYYALGRRGWIFQAAVVGLSVLLYATWMPLCRTSLQCMVFLSCGSLLFVAAAPCFRLRLDGMVHYTSAVVCCVSVFLWQILSGLWDVMLWWVWVCGMLTLTGRSKWCWWVEVAAIGSLLSNLWRIV